MNYLANALPLNGKTTGQLSDQYPNLFVPAGITFSIWGVIYLLLLVFCILQFFRKNNDAVQSIGSLVIINFGLNAAWIVSWHYEFIVVSLLIMAGLLLTLVFINKSLIGNHAYFFKLTFGIYLGWICIAAIANVTTLLVHYNWTGFGITEEVWAILMILAGCAIAGFVIQRLKNPFIAIAVCWGFMGIILKRHDDYSTIAIASAVSIGFVAAYAGYLVLKQSKAVHIR